MCPWRPQSSVRPHRVSASPMQCLGACALLRFCCSSHDVLILSRGLQSLPNEGILPSPPPLPAQLGCCCFPPSLQLRAKPTSPWRLAFSRPGRGATAPERARSWQQGPSGDTPGHLDFRGVPGVRDEAPDMVLHGTGVARNLRLKLLNTVVCNPDHQFPLAQALRRPPRLAAVQRRSRGAEAAVLFWSLCVSV